MVENRLNCLQEGAHAPLLLRTGGRTGLHLLGASGQPQSEVFRHGRPIHEQRGKSLLVDLVDSHAREGFQSAGFADAREQPRESQSERTQSNPTSPAREVTRRCRGLPASAKRPELGYAGATPCYGNPGGHKRSISDLGADRRCARWRDQGVGASARSRPSCLSSAQNSTGIFGAKISTFWATSSGDRVPGITVATTGWPSGNCSAAVGRRTP
jgi:hypothetical protein